MRMQIDMFAVELGAALLLQFETDERVVRILADAGEARFDVNGRLPRAIRDFGDESLKIDLLIGTHYDADHLEGLVAIIENSTIEIGEAWLPPVADDTIPHAASDLPEEHFLAAKFAQSHDGAALNSYLVAKAGICDELASKDHSLRRQWQRERGETFYQLDPDIFKSRSHLDAEDLPGALRYFQSHIDHVKVISGMAVSGHADEPILDPWSVYEKTISDLTFWGLDAEAWLEAAPSLASLATLALVRESHARDAITAVSLAKVVAALRNRGVKMRWTTIPDGEPRRFYWHEDTQRFSPLKSAQVGGPELLLLGPSDGLVKKLWDKLPIGDYMLRAHLEAIAIKPITASNQLSYTLSVEYVGQRILITGDAGCVDFRTSARIYHPNLIAALSPLQVVQVAHHGGNNAHFYRCLLESHFPEQEDLAYLLLSHATNDKHRPSDVFSKFIEALGRNEEKIQLLFTSQPQESKVRDIKRLIASVSPGGGADHGDVRLLFDKGWRVKSHAVRVA